ncbi:MAG: hypothetical protein ACQEUB_14935, partial [Thermodesulfobacteriota bacterium]
AETRFALYHLLSQYSAPPPAALNYFLGQSAQKKKFAGLIQDQTLGCLSPSLPGPDHASLPGQMRQAIQGKDFLSALDSRAGMTDKAGFCFMRGIMSLASLASKVNMA